MLLKNILASKSDKKVTISNGEMRKLIGAEYSKEEVTVWYDGVLAITFKKTRKGTTWYAKEILPKKYVMPVVGKGVYHDIYINSIFSLKKTPKKSSKKKPTQISFKEYLIDKNKPVSTDKFSLIRDWANQRGLYEKGDVKTQFLKLQEETGELAKALLKNDRNEIIDAIGDIVVVLTNLTQLTGIFVEVKGDVTRLRNITIEDCIDTAYNVIKLRTGSMQNGTFVKNER